MSVTDETTRQRDAAFELLLSVVDDLRVSGRRTFSAGLKPEMQRRSNHGFSEARLGYATFRTFLADAEQRGLVKLTPNSTGPDVTVERLVATTPLPTVPSASNRRTRIRPDLWKAFVDWREDWRRVYDVGGNRALMFPNEPHPVGELPEYTQVREQVQLAADRYIDISPITQETQVGWMRAFADAESDSAFRAELIAALTTHRPASSFTNHLRTRPQALSRWNRVRQERVEETIAAWAQTAPVTVEYLELVQPMAPTSVRQGATLPAEETQLRAAVQHAVEVMPLADLLRLSIPLEYLIQR